jgi:hypothetical protein
MHIAVSATPLHAVLSVLPDIGKYALLTMPLQPTYVSTIPQHGLHESIRMTVVNGRM